MNYDKSVIDGSSGTIRPTTDFEQRIREHYARLVGAVGRNAIVCRCGHVDYLPNGKTWLELDGISIRGANLTDNVIFTESCLECREE